MFMVIGYTAEVKKPPISTDKGVRVYHGDSKKENIADRGSSLLKCLVVEGQVEPSRN